MTVQAGKLAKDVQTNLTTCLHEESVVPLVWPDRVLVGLAVHRSKFVNPEQRSIPTYAVLREQRRAGTLCADAACTPEHQRTQQYDSDGGGRQGEFCSSRSA